MYTSFTSAVCKLAVYITLAKFQRMRGVLHHLTLIENYQHFNNMSLLYLSSDVSIFLFFSCGGLTVVGLA